MMCTRRCGNNAVYFFMKKLGEIDLFLIMNVYETKNRLSYNITKFYIFEKNMIK